MSPWQCTDCDTHNAAATQVCDVCGGARRAVPPPRQGGAARSDTRTTPSGHRSQRPAAPSLDPPRLVPRPTVPSPRPVPRPAPVRAVTRPVPPVPRRGAEGEPPGHPVGPGYRSRPGSRGPASALRVLAVGALAVALCVSVAFYAAGAVGRALGGAEPTASVAADRSADAAVEQAARVAALIGDSSRSRAAVKAAVPAVKACRDLGTHARTFQRAAGERGRQLSAARTLAVSALPGGAEWRRRWLARSRRPGGRTCRSRPGRTSCVVTAAGAGPTPPISGPPIAPPGRPPVTRSGSSHCGPRSPSRRDCRSSTTPRYEGMGAGSRLPPTAGQRVQATGLSVPAGPTPAGSAFLRSPALSKS